MQGVPNPFADRTLKEDMSPVFRGRTTPAANRFRNYTLTKQISLSAQSISAKQPGKDLDFIWNPCPPNHQRIIISLGWWSQHLVDILGPEGSAGGRNPPIIHVTCQLNLVE